MGNTIGSFIRADEYAEADCYVMSGKHSCCSKIVTEGEEAGLDIVTIEEAEGGVLCIAPRRVAEKIRDLLNANPDVIDNL